MLVGFFILGENMNAASAYIHYHIESFDGSSRYGEEVPDYKWLNITEAKNKMMQTFKDISLQKLVFSSSNGKSVSK